jgi:hypothetical protein
MSTSTRWTDEGQEKLMVAGKLYKAAVGYAARKEHTQAIRVCNDALRLRRQVLLPHEAPVMECVDFLACMYKITSDFKKHKETLLELQRLTVDLYGEYHPEVLKVMERYYTACVQAGDQREADLVSGMIWNWRGQYQSSETSVRSLEDQLKRLPTPAQLQGRLDSTLGLFPGTQIEPLPPRTSRFLDPSWSPLKELELAKQRRANGGVTPTPPSPAAASPQPADAAALQDASPSTPPPALPAEAPNNDVEGPAVTATPKPQPD